MFKRIKDKISLNNIKSDNQNSEEMIETQTKLTDNLLDNIINIREKYSNSSDFVMREINITPNNKISLLISEGMVNISTVSEMICEPLLKRKFTKDTKPVDIYNFITNKSLLAMDLKDIYSCEEVFNFIMSGFVVILIDGMNIGLALGAQGFQFRSISEPSSEVNERGSREGFTEPIRINLTMIRRRIKSPDLKFEMFSMGSVSKTSVCMVYMKNSVSKKLLRDIRHRLRQVKLDVILESGYIQPFLEGKPLSLFSDVGTTERPDTVCAKINEGRVVVLVDGTPFALVVPYMFNENFQSIDDYCHRPYYATFIRFLKYTAFAISILLPALYVAMGTFHPELLPYSLLFNIAASQLTTPFPLMIEALIIHLIYEVMREAGLRLPRPVGHAVSIVGALVIGDAAVTAGLIGSPMVMIVAVTAISSFVVPSLYESVVVLRLGFIIIGGTFGLFGIVLGILLVLNNMCSLSSYGVPYMAPVSPFSFKALGDIFSRISWKKLQDKKNVIQELDGVNIDDGGE